MISILAILAGLAVAAIAGGFYLHNIKDNDLIVPSCAGLGIAAFGLVSLFFAPIYGIIAGITIFLVTLLVSLKSFDEQGEVFVYQPALFRGGTALNPQEWALMYPGLRLAWKDAVKEVAKIQSGKIVVTGDDGGEISVNFQEGVGTVRFRIDADTPISLDPSDPNYHRLLALFVKAVPSGKGLSDSAARVENIRQICITRLKRVIEAASENISALKVDAEELQKAVQAVPKGGTESLLDVALREIEAKTGLPVSSIKLEIEDAEPGEDAKKVIAADATNKQIRQNAEQLLIARGIAPVDEQLLVFMAEQRRDAEVFRKMSPAELDDVSSVAKIIRLRKELDAMIPPDKVDDKGKRVDPKSFSETVFGDKQGLQKAQAINAYRAQYARAESDLEIAEREERSYRKEAVQRDDENLAAEKPLAAGASLDPKKIAFAERKLGEIDTYRTLYGVVLDAAVDKTAAGADTSRVSIAGLESLGNARGLDALHILAGKIGK